MIIGILQFRYAEQNGYGNIVHYTDDGWSSGNFDRPDWKRLIGDIEAGLIGTVIVKDISSIGISPDTAPTATPSSPP